MFLRRKRRPEEDDSLVPHGLIWHATAERSDRDQKLPATPEAKISKLIQMPPAPAPRKSAAGVEDVALKKPPRGISPFWRSLGPPATVEPSAAPERTLAPPAPVPIRKESLPIRETGAAQPNVSPAQKLSRSAARKGRTLSAARLTRIQSRVFGRISQAQESVKRAKAGASSALGRIYRRSLEVWRSVKTSLSRLDALGALKGLGQKSANAMRAQSRRLTGAIHMPQKSSWDFDLGAIFTPVVRRVRALSWRPPTIGFKAFTMELKIPAAREMAKWKLRLPGLPLGGKLASRVRPLILPALLVLGVAFAVRHYATRALPSHARPATPAAYRPVQVPARPLPRRYQARAPQPGNSKVASGGKRQPTSQARRNQRTQTSAAAGGDYVAPDTYVYYGQNGKDTR